MENNNIDKLLQKKLYSYQVEPEGKDAIWNSISRRLKFKRRLLATVCACAAITVAFYFALTPLSEKPYNKDLINPIIQPVENGRGSIATLIKTQSIEKTSQTTINIGVKKNVLNNKSGYMADSGVLIDTIICDPAFEPANEPWVEHTAISKEKEDVGITNLSDYDTRVYTDDFGYKVKKNKLALALNSNIVQGSNDRGGVHKSSMMSNVNGVGTSLLMERISDVKYSLPITFGVQVQFKITNLISVGVGANYAYNKSKYDVLINKKKGEVKQHMHYIGIPVNIYANLLSKNGFNLYANAGVTMDKLLRTSYNIKYYDGSTSFNNTLKGLEWAVNFGLGLEYRFVNFAGIYLEPNAVYFFNSKTPNSIRNNQPFQLKAEIGMRFHL